MLIIINSERIIVINCRSDGDQQINDFQYVDDERKSRNKQFLEMTVTLMIDLH